MSDEKIKKKQSSDLKGAVSSDEKIKTSTVAKHKTNIAGTSKKLNKAQANEKVEASIVANRKINIAGTNKKLNENQVNKVSRSVEKKKPKAEKITSSENITINLDTEESQAIKKTKDSSVDDLIYIDSKDKKYRVIKFIGSLFNANKRQKSISGSKFKKKIILLLVFLFMYILVYQFLLERTTIQSRSVVARRRSVANLVVNKEVDLNDKSKKMVIESVEMPTVSNEWGLEFNKRYVSTTVAIDDAELTDNFTIELWLNIRDKFECNIPLVTFKLENFITDELFLTSDQKIGFFSYARDSVVEDNIFVFREKALRISMDESYHIALTKEGLSVVLYINGRRVANHILDNVQSLSRQSLTIVDRLQDSYESGLIVDEIRVSNVNLYKSVFVPSRKLGYQEGKTIFYGPCEYVEGKNSQFVYWTKTNRGIIESPNFSWVNIKEKNIAVSKVLEELRNR